MSDRSLEEMQQELDLLKKQLNQQVQTIRSLQDSLDTARGVTRSAPQAPLQRWSSENFIGLRLIHFIGIIVLVIGLSIGVKYAIDRELISEPARVLLAYAAGIALFVLSIRLRKKYTVFSAILFSGAMASLYFTTYAAEVKYHLLGFGPAFILMVLLTVYTCIEALRYNRQEIAILGLAGAYAIPFLISQNADRADLFFLYITLINIGIVYLSIRKNWRFAGMIAGGITWLLAIGWAAARSGDAYAWAGLLFFPVFFLLFLGTVTGWKWKSHTLLSDQESYAVVLNNLAFYIASLFVLGVRNPDHQLLPAITGVATLLIALQAWSVYRFFKSESRTAQLLASTALIFLLLTIAFYWDGLLVTFSWLLVAILLFAYGFLRKSARLRMAAIVLMGGTLAKLLLLDSLVFSPEQKVVAYLALGVLLLVVSFFYQKYRGQLFNDK